MLKWPAARTRDFSGADLPICVNLRQGSPWKRQLAAGVPVPLP
jgi:hypothetical protein